MHKILNDLLSVDNSSVSYLVLLDLCAVFDTIALYLLQSHLPNEIGLSGAVLNWFISYL